MVIYVGPFVVVAVCLTIWINRLSYPWSWGDSLAVMLTVTAWPLVEALLHKFVMHNPATRFWIIYHNHLNHHTTPTIKNGLTPIWHGIEFGVVGWLLSTRPVASEVFGTLLVMFVVYEVSHCLIHLGWAPRSLIKHHMDHHT